MRNWPLLALVCVGLGYGAEPRAPISIHPENPRYFLFRGKPTFLLTASEHYGSVMNRAFDFERYLDDAAAHKMTHTRTFLLFRELQGARNPSSPAKPESPDYVAPFPRTGPGVAMDGEPMYDLDQWNPEYSERLHRFLKLASEKGIVVELTVFSNTYADQIWALNPFRSKNNKQGVGKIEWPEYLSLKDRELVRRQADYARKIIRETADYDNIYYEICNEPGGAVPDHNVSPADVDAWQAEMGAAMRDEMTKIGKKHLIAGQQAFAYSPKFRFPNDQTFQGTLFDIANVHPLPDTVLRDRTYQLGHFMSKELMLSEFAAFTKAASLERKPLLHDEDNTASMYRDVTGWTIHRKRAWTSLLNGAHYDYIDFSITVGSEAGTAASRAGIRSWMKYLSEFMSGFDFVHSRPDTKWIAATPAATLTVSGLVSTKGDYIAYLGDNREVDAMGYGEPIEGKATLQLPVGSFAVSLFSPVTGQASPSITVEGGKTVSVDLGTFRHDIVVRATRDGGR